MKESPLHSLTKLLQLILQQYVSGVDSHTAENVLVTLNSCVSPLHPQIQLNLQRKQHFPYVVGIRNWEGKNTLINSRLI